MPQKALHKTLLELQIELDQLHFTNEAQKTKIDQQILALEEKLRQESFMSSEAFLFEQLKEQIESLEESHPKITEVTGKLFDLLAKMGI
jgi:hypothetical protein